MQFRRSPSYSLDLFHSAVSREIAWKWRFQTKIFEPKLKTRLLGAHALSKTSSFKENHFNEERTVAQPAPKVQGKRVQSERRKEAGGKVWISIRTRLGLQQSNHIFFAQLDPNVE